MLKKPKGDGCYIIGMFSESSVCPDFDDVKSREPKCKRFNKELNWNVSGKVLKCEECLKDSTEA